MGGSLTLRVRCRPESLSQVRHALARLELDETTSAAVAIVANELVGNSVRHSDLSQDGEIEIVVQRVADCIRIDVRDCGTGLTMPRQGEGGRGLPIVQQLSSRFGISRDQHTHAWAEIEIG